MNDTTDRALLIAELNGDLGAISDLLAIGDQQFCEAPDVRVASQRTHIGVPPDSWVTLQSAR